MEEEGRWITTKHGNRVFIKTTNAYMNEKIRSLTSKSNEQKKQFQLTDEQIDEVISESISEWDDNYAGLYITRMDPKDFLKLTATSKAMEWIENDKFDLDIKQVEAKKRVADMMYLDIDLETGKVRGHEGRHRAYSFQNAGYNKIDIVVFPYNYDKYQAKEYNNFNLKGQEVLSFQNATLEKLIPVSKANINRIKKRDY